MSTEPIDTGAPSSNQESAVGSGKKLLSDTLASRYKIIKEIGHGTVGTVYLAQDQKLNRYVAIKRLDKTGSRTAVAIQRQFLRKAQMIASLGHIHISNIYDISKDDAAYYIAMEYVPGPLISEDLGNVTPPLPVTLREFITIRGAMSSEDVKNMTTKISRALEYAHNRGVVHQDINPSNILLNEEYEPKLVDFGLHKPIGHGSSVEITLIGAASRASEYIAPEQWTDSEVDERTDVYALGGVMWFMLTGKTPKEFEEIAIPDDLRQPIATALHCKPSERYDSVSEFTSAFDRSQKVESKPEPDRGGMEEASDRWRCSNCKNANPDSAKYCIKCGTYGLEACPVCESEVRLGMQFCPNCGIDVKQAEKSASFVAEARNFAEFHEYESALNSVKDLDNRAHPEALELAKEWRSIVLNRRNLLTELDSAIRVYSMKKAIEIQQKLKPVIPEECLSDSADFDIVVKYSSLATELKELLRDSAARAQDDYNLENYSASIDHLNQVCGSDACQTINTELRNINKDLDKLVTNAGLAMGMNCISRAHEMLLSAAPWKGSELGKRRQVMIKHCEELISKRDELIDNLEETIRKSQYAESLQYIRQTGQFRLPPNYSEMEPDHDDLAANERIVHVDKLLTQKFEQNIPEWIENDDWDTIDRAVSALKDGGDDDGAWKRLREDLRNRVNKKIATLYNNAVQLETRGRLGQAYKAWADFLAVPEHFCPSHLWQYGIEFPKRKQHTTQKRMNKLVKRVLFILFVTWIYPTCKTGFLIVIAKASDPSDLITAGAANFGLFIVVTGLLLIKNRKLNRTLQSGDFTNTASFTMHFLFMLMAFSPISFTLYQFIDFISTIFLFELPPVTILLSISFLWIFIDLLRRYRWQFDGVFSLTIGWLIVAVIVSASKGFGLLTYELWPGIAIAHGVLFLALIFIERTMAGKASLDKDMPTVPSSIPEVANEVPAEEG